MDFSNKKVVHKEPTRKEYLEFKAKLLGNYEIKKLNERINNLNEIIKSLKAQDKLFIKIDERVMYKQNQIEQLLKRLAVYKENPTHEDLVNKILNQKEEIANHKKRATEYRRLYHDLLSKTYNIQTNG